MAHAEAAAISNFSHMCVKGEKNSLVHSSSFIELWELITFISHNTNSEDQETNIRV